MGFKRKPRDILVWVLLIFGAMPFSESGSAMQFYPGNHTTIDVDISLTYAAAWRSEDPEKSKLGKFNPRVVNADDGNENFDQYDMIYNKFNAIADIDIQHENVGLFLRPKAFYDFVYMGDNANDSPLTNNNNALFGGPLTRTDDFTEETEDRHGRDAELLDVFAYANFDVAGHNTELRVGRQVISWGESLYVSGGIASAQTYADQTATNSPGVELKGIYLPTEAVSVIFGITDHIALSAYYQWKWEKHRLDEAGSFFSTKDFLDEAGHVLLLPEPFGPTPRGIDKEARDDGQYGVALTIFTNWFNSTEFGLYFINYHEKSPMLKLIPFNSYYLDYAEDVKLYGASFSTQVGDANVSGEISYRTDYMVATPTMFVYEKADILQAQVSAIYNAGSSPVYSDLSINGEAGFNQVESIDGDKLGADSFAWGFVAVLTPKWYQLLQDLDMSAPVKYTCNPNGTSSYIPVFAEGADNLSVGLEFIYKSVYITNIEYVAFFNADKNEKSDRDYFSINFKHTF